MLWVGLLRVYHPHIVDPSLEVVLVLSFFVFILLEKSFKFAIEADILEGVEVGRTIKLSEQFAMCRESSAPGSCGVDEAQSMLNCLNTMQILLHGG